MTSNHEKILISACLLGDRVRHDGICKSLGDERIRQWSDQGRLIKYCPEVAGGLSTPRPAAEIEGANAEGVFNGLTRVITAQGTDLSSAFLKGAQATLALAQEHNIKFALFKAYSPSCGNEYVYNGRFDGALTRGIGVTTALLWRHGVRVFNELQLDELEEALG